MAELFKAKVRNVGTSLGILIPMEIVRNNNLKEGQETEIAIYTRNNKLIDESFGKDKGKIKFEFRRNKEDRTKRY